MINNTANATRLITTVWKYADWPVPYPPPPQPYPPAVLVGADELEVVVAVRGFTKRSDDIGAVGKSGVVVDMLKAERRRMLFRCR